MKRKNLLKKISLGAVGVASIGAIAFGVSKIVQVCKNDTKTLSLDYSVGALTDEGKYQEDECKLYTKKAFACEGLRVTFDFDSEVNGQFYFYDINDKYLSKSDVITEGSSVSIPLNGAYARAVIIPTEDEDGKISFTEKYKYSSQMQVKVDKKAESNINNKFKKLNNNLLQVCDNTSELVFKAGLTFNADKLIFVGNSSDNSSTTECLLNVNGFKKIIVDKELFDKDYNGKSLIFTCYFFDENLNYLGIGKNSVDNSVANVSCDIKTKTKFVLFNCYSTAPVSVVSNYINLA